VHGNLYLGRSTLIGARSKTVTDYPFEAADVGLHVSVAAATLTHKPHVGT
jgi:hypothetical protein